MVIVPPSMRYVEYLNGPVLGILFCLMVVIGGFRESGIFSVLLSRLLLRLGTFRQLVMVLVFSCFFVSMWVTNDVSLLTFVPFALLSLRRVASEKEMAVVISLQTIAANLGSMCTPVGNPQNLYLYFHYALNLGEFMALLLPYTIAAMIMLAVSVFCCRTGKFLFPHDWRPGGLRKFRLWLRHGSSGCWEPCFPFVTDGGPSSGLPYHAGGRRPGYGADGSALFSLC